MSESQIRTKVLLDIRERLNAWERDLKHFRLREPTDSELKELEILQEDSLPVIIREELEYDIHDLNVLINERCAALTESQEMVFAKIMEAINSDGTAYVFIDARGGTGKTYLLNTLLAAVRAKHGGCVALAVGSTGIASNLLHLGRTLHSQGSFDYRQGLCVQHTGPK